MNNYIQNILKPKNSKNLSIPSQNHEFFKFAFNEFDYFMIKDIEYLLQNEFIEKTIPDLSDFEEFTKNYINSNRDIIWTLFVKYGYLNFIYENVKKLKIKNEEIKKFIEEKFTNWKIYLYKKYEDIIDLFIENYDEEKIENLLKSLIIEKKYNSEYDSLDKYYTLIYSLLSLNDKYAVVTKKILMKMMIFVNYYLLIKNI